MRPQTQAFIFRTEEPDLGLAENYPGLIVCPACVILNSSASRHLRSREHLNYMQY